MNQDSLSFALTQISYLVSNVTKRNFSQNSRQIHKLVQQFGLEADRHYLRCLVSQIDFGDTQAAKTSLQAKLLSTELTTVLDKPSLISNICYAFDSLLESRPIKPTIVQISKALNFSPIQEVALSIAFQNSSTEELVKNAEQHLKICLPNLLTSYINLDTSVSSHELNLNDISSELLQLILSRLSHGKHKQYNINDSVYNKFIDQLCKDFPKERVPLILAPLLYSENFGIDPDSVFKSTAGLLTSAIMDTSWSTMVMEIGYAFTANVVDCKSHLTKIGGQALTGPDVARIISLMCRTHTNLSDGSINLPTPNAFWGGQNDKDKSITSGTGDNTWKPEILVQALKEVSPNLSWREVCFGFDHPEFVIKDRTALQLLLTIVRLGVQSTNQAHMLLAECMYRHWVNIEAQFSLINIILKNPDMYCFGDQIYASVSMELLKTPPELDKEMSAWKSLHLVEILLYMADNGFFGVVSEVFKAPIQQCPDVLFMALLQINPPITVARQELFSILLPIFFGNHPNSGAILHHAWNAPNLSHNLKHYIMQAMSDWYTRGDYDQSRLARILDVAQDLKALSNLLNARSFMFVIDLACLASRREYLKLEKWLSDKIHEHGEPFVQAIVKFLQRRCPQIVGIKIPDDQIPKSAQLPQDTLLVIFNCLQACVGKVQQELSDVIMTMVGNCNLLLNKNRPVPGGVPSNVIRGHRGGLDAPFTGGLNNQVFGAAAMDGIAAGLNTNMAALNLSGGPASNFNYGNMLGNLVSNPASPGRLLTGAGGGGGGAGQSNSPFQMMPMQNVTGSTMARGVNPTVNQSVNPMPEQPVSKEVEEEANSYFQRMYDHPPNATLGIDEVLDMLQRFQESNSRREREVYQCMLRNLFEEYKFFPQYPEKELQITAQLFGGMIERQLVTTCVALGLALRCVLDALKKTQGSKMYQFGIIALDKFKTKLNSYQKYCEHVRAIPNFNDFPPDLIQYVEFGAQGQEPPNKPLALAPVPAPSAASLYRSNSVTGNIVTTPTASKPTPTAPMGRQQLKSIANATNIDTLLSAAENKETFTSPPDTVQDKTAFIFNNLSQLNLTQKCEEIKEIMQPEYYPWLSHYLVLKRASIELNFHGLYSNFLDAMKIAEVNKLVTKETFRNIKVLLRTDKGISNFSDRSLLKSLGHWLGILTLARNRPILQIDIDLKSLLVEAYHKGHDDLLYVVPFVAKVLESCAKSKVFKPPNPWTMAIMNVLAELHQEQDLKLSLKFEIEVLCKNLAIDVSELKPAIYLKDPDRINNIEYQLSRPAKQKEMAMPTLPTSEETTTATSNIASASPSNIDTSGLITATADPRFSVNDITTGTLTAIHPHIIYSNIQLLMTHPQLKSLVRSALERTISEWITLVVDRSVKIALKTGEQIVKKDFALDPDENALRTAAHNIVRNLSAGTAMISYRDNLYTTIQTQIKTAFSANLPNVQKEVIESAAMQLANDNIELICVFMQKTAMDKATLEIDKLLTPEYEVRKQARQEGRRFFDANVLNYQRGLPEAIRLKAGATSPTQWAVYEEFARNIPGFLPIAVENPVAADFMPKLQNFFQDQLAPIPPTVANIAPFQTTMHIDEIGAMYDEINSKMESFLGSAMNVNALHLHISNIRQLYEALMNMRRTRDQGTAVALLGKTVETLMEGLVSIPDYMDQIRLYGDIHLRILRLLQDNRSFGVTWTNKTIAKYMMEVREEIRYNVDAVDFLISSNFVNVQHYDQLLTQLIDNGSNFIAINFAMQLLQMYYIDERPNSVVTENDFVHTIELLTRLSVHPRAPEGLAHLIEVLRSSHDPTTQLVDRAMSGPISFIHSGMVQARNAEFMENDGFAGKIEHLFRHWTYSYHNDVQGRDQLTNFRAFVSRMNLLGILKGDEPLSRFFRVATQLCTDASYGHLLETGITAAAAKQKTFQWVDAYTRLIALLIKHTGDGTNSASKFDLLNKVLGIVIGTLLNDQDTHGTNFQQVAFHRIFIMLFFELSAHDPVLENMSVSVVTAFCHTYHMLRPSVAPGFCYSWLELISNRVFLGRILAQIPQQKGWYMYSQLLIDLFKYLAPFLRNAELAKPVAVLYKGTLRVLLVLLHDFPEFLCDYHFGFCDVIPPNCIQMRNLILSAYPRSMRLPDPFTPNLKVQMLNEITVAPRICSNYVAAIQPQNFKKDLDSYLKQRAPVSFFAELKRNLQVSNEPGSRYNIPLMNALVLYVGTQAIAHIKAKNLIPSKATVAHSAHMDVFQNLAVDSDNECRYLFLNAIANQLRYPNSHTHYFSCALLYLFGVNNSVAIQEQITRVLLERLIVNRPHPWGLLITFIELLKNPEYEFWDHDFVHCAPEIDNLFESVARSCMVVRTSNQQQQQQQQQQQNAGSENELAE